MAGASTGGEWQAPPTPAAGGLTAAAAGKGHAGASAARQIHPQPHGPAGRSRCGRAGTRQRMVRPRAPSRGRLPPLPVTPPATRGRASITCLHPSPARPPLFLPDAAARGGAPPPRRARRPAARHVVGGGGGTPLVARVGGEGGAGGGACARRRRGGGEGGAPEAPIHRRARERRGWVSPDSHRRAPWRQRRAAAPRQPHLDSRTAGRCGDAAMKAKVRKIPFAPRAPPTGESPPPHPRVPITCRHPCRRGAQSRAPAAGATAPPPAAPSRRRGGGAAPASPPAPLPASARTRWRG